MGHDIAAFLVVMMAFVAGPTSAGKFISFEGLDGCGKSTQLEKLADAAGQDIDVVTTREPEEPRLASAFAPCC